MEPNHIHQTIAGQIDNMKPAHLTPGRDVGMQAVDANTLRVLVNRPSRRLFDVRYDEGPDTYTLTTRLWWAEAATWSTPEILSGVYCDQLGELIFGETVAEPFTLPQVLFSDDDGETWEVIA